MWKGVRFHVFRLCLRIGGYLLSEVRNWSAHISVEVSTTCTNSNALGL